MQPIEIQTIVNGEVAVSVNRCRSPRPDASRQYRGPMSLWEICPSWSNLGVVGTQVGLAVGTTSCNNGEVNLDWFALPNNDHPVIPQNLYRMSGGTTTTSASNKLASPG